MFGRSMLVSGARAWSKRLRPIETVGLEFYDSIGWR